jgi:hypothetical protein
VNGGRPTSAPTIYAIQKDPEQGKKSGGGDDERIGDASMKNSVAAPQQRNYTRSRADLQAEFPIANVAIVICRTLDLSHKSAGTRSPRPNRR